MAKKYAGVKHAKSRSDIFGIINDQSSAWY